MLEVTLQCAKQGALSMSLDRPKASWSCCGGFGGVLAASLIIATGFTLGTLQVRAGVGSASRGAPATVAYLHSEEQLLARAQGEWAAADHRAVIETLSTLLERPSLSHKALATALFNRGNAYLHVGDADRALVDFTTLEQRRHPQMALVYLKQAMAHELLGDMVSAASTYVRALREAPENPVVNRHINRFFQRQ